MTIRIISAIPTQDGKAVLGHVKVESRAQYHGEPAARINLVVLLPNKADSEFERPLHERVYDEALKYLDIA